MAGHTDISIRWAVEPGAASHMDTGALRAHFLIADLFVPGRVRLVYTHYDRMIVGGAVPEREPLELEPVRETGTRSFLERRELIAFNLGGRGVVSVDGEALVCGPRDMAYAGMGSTVRLESEDLASPARFYLLSAPAHARHPPRLIRQAEARRLDLGDAVTANQRSVFRYIHEDGPARTCQLVAGMTTFAPGSVWNTMPPHVHDRRMEAYLYFDLPDTARVIHLMGAPAETRHLVVANEQAVLSPPWSIHAGVGTACYAFVWAMAGDNADYADIDPVAAGELR